MKRLLLALAWFLCAAIIAIAKIPETVMSGLSPDELRPDVYGNTAATTGSDVNASWTPRWLTYKQAGGRLSLSQFQALGAGQRMAEERRVGVGFATGGMDELYSVSELTADIYGNTAATSGSAVRGWAGSSGQAPYVQTVEGATGQTASQFSASHGGVSWEAYSQGVRRIDGGTPDASGASAGRSYGATQSTATQYTPQAGERSVSFPVSFERGYNMRDLPERMPAGFYTQDSQNFVPYADGTARKRGGITLDENLAGADTSVNLLKQVDIGIPTYPRNWTLAIAGNKWRKRDNEMSVGTYTSLTVPTGLRTDGDDILSATTFNGRLIGGGDLSALWQFDGTNIYRLILPTEADSIGYLQITTGTCGQAFDSTTTYYYAMSYGDIYTGAQNLYEESWASQALSVTTTDGYDSPHVWTGIPKYPRAFGKDSDSAVVAIRNIYRGTSTSDLYWIAAITDTATTFTDTGYVADETKKIPPRKNVFQSGIFPTEYYDFLWTIGYNKFHRASTKIAFPSEDLLPYYANVSPVNSGYSSVCKAHEADSSSRTYEILSALQRTKITWSGANLISNGVIPGDYLIQLSPAYGDSYLFRSARVVAVLSESTFVVDDTISAPNRLYYDENIPVCATVGNNIFRLGDASSNEIVGVGGWVGGDIEMSVGAALVMNRAMFGTTAESHLPTIYYPMYRMSNLNGAYGTDGLIYTEAFNPIRQTNLSNPLLVDPGNGGAITGLLKMAGWLGVFKERATYGVTVSGGGNDPASDFSVRRVSSVGNVAPRALASYQGGAITLDGANVWYQGTDGDGNDVRKMLSESLGGVIGDSVTTDAIRKASGFVYADKYYLAVPYNSTGDCHTYVFDFTTGAWTRYTGWAPNVWEQWAESTDRLPYLYFGSRKRGDIFKVNEAIHYDSVKTSVGNITAQLVTPRYAANERVYWTHMVLSVEHSDSLSFSARISDEAGRLTEYPLTVAGQFSPTAGDTTSAGVARPIRIPINRSGYGLQLVIKSVGTGRCVVHPGMLYGIRRPL